MTAHARALTPDTIEAADLAAALGDAFTPSAWVADALCREIGHDVFFPEKGQSHQVRAVKRVCGRCPVLGNCLTEALTSREPHGVWGGTSPSQRHAILDQHGFELPDTWVATDPELAARIAAAVKPDVEAFVTAAKATEAEASRVATALAVVISPEPTRTSAPATDGRAAEAGPATDAADPDQAAQQQRRARIQERVAAADTAVKASNRRLAALIADDTTADPGTDSGPSTPVRTDIDVEALLGSLTSRERLVLTDIFGLNDGVTRTVADVAAHLGVRAELVSRTARTALEKLRAATAAPCPNAA